MPRNHNHQPRINKEIHEFLLDLAELGKKAERILETPDSQHTFMTKCLQNKTTPKLLRDVEELGKHVEDLKDGIQKAKYATVIPAVPKTTTTATDLLASFAGKAIAEAIRHLPPLSSEPSGMKRGGGVGGVGREGKPRKCRIPAALRKQVWNHYIGAPVGQTACPICQTNTIDKLGFEAGHVVPESAGGPTTLDNLRPICADCNRSMGAMNMWEYQARYYGR